MLGFEKVVNWVINKIFVFGFTCDCKVVIVGL